jgi:hypothetical protein
MAVGALTSLNLGVPSTGWTVIENHSTAAAGALYTGNIATE